MNNPPDISPVEHETEEYAHEVHAHVTKYLMVGGLLLAFHRYHSRPLVCGLRRVLSHLFHTNLSEGQGRKANVTVALLVATFKAGLVAAIFMHLAAEKRLIYRVLIFTGFFVLGLFWLTYLAWYDPIHR